ncbi:MAG: HAD-IIA family hydrolase [Acidimicrobiia bacterium]|nr:HAD-IIA family hydrolase [Acidimicrobiia bacterium]
MNTPVIACDLDGVIWRGEEPIAGSAETIHALQNAGARVAFLTNNSSKTVAGVVSRLAEVGIQTDPASVITSAQSAVALLAESVSNGARILACAGAGVVEALEMAGYEVVSEGPAEAVVVGWHRHFDFDGLDRASAAVRAGARFIASNDDPTYPTATGVQPGAGSIVAAVATASGQSAEIAGKPHPAMAALVRSRLGPTGVIVGDRPSTDGAMAIALDWPFALVLSGIGGNDPHEPIPEPPPALVGTDLADLLPGLMGILGFTN